MGEDADSAKAALWQDKVFNLKQQYDAMLTRFEKDHPDYYILKYRIKTTSVQEVQKMLDDDTAMAEYSPTRIQFSRSRNLLSRLPLR